MSADLSVEQVDQLRDQLDEQHEEMRQITDMLGQPMGGVGDLDYDDVEAELEVRFRPKDSALFPVLCEMLLLPRDNRQSAKSHH